MSTVTENDLKELKELIIDNNKTLEMIINNQKVLEKGQADLKEQLTGIDKRLAIVETRLEDWKPSIDKIPDLAEKVGELKNWRQFLIITVTAVFSGFIGWFIRGGTFKP
ncbi:hypothetical protein WH8501_02995 [Crocosphaera watsonii WH 8501]|uniref:Uncharacterized protein n=4 Tax=Crocosphaera watsonii TaxID=263511 RepID=Q4CAD1_CROWT|nr:MULTISPECIES: hypothetical protein [Crocosphaera]EAM53005.1 hypothetical protein CwatDRAFT_6165 [Crocosphaera watsonii WH 8501]EHJ15080.1 hypothetical protein CWATWH0003_0259 [Crocosphaera watsonii WH 0003]NQZ63574.1 hypothetical protein [Crocosphaera sp.]CCQ57032.1 hypothetical protein CWATWH0005_5264 [Crocosphaera watsonii WH 0005]CCQ63872.1 hypothetical protein CWATWH0401_3984 [Crocosphaera watsonii WH 0401]